MNRKELEDKLAEEGLPNDLYSLRGGLPNEAYCLEEVGEQWAVYYSELGQRTGEMRFASEADACEYFYKTLSVPGGPAVGESVL
jgi:hypothetical protein